MSKDRPSKGRMKTSDYFLDKFHAVTRQRITEICDHMDFPELNPEKMCQVNLEGIGKGIFIPYEEAGKVIV